MSQRLVLVVALASMLTLEGAGCATPSTDAPGPAPDEGAGAPLEDASQAAAAPSAAGEQVHLEPLPDAVRVTLAPDRVSVDPGGWRRSALARMEAADVRVPLTAVEAPAPTPAEDFVVDETHLRSSFLLTLLYDHLSALYQAERSFATRAGLEPELKLIVEVPPEAPYQLVTQVVYTAGQAAFTDIGFVVEVDGLEKLLPIVMPRYQVRRDSEPPSDVGAMPLVMVVEGGAQVRATPSSTSGAFMLEKLAVSPREAHPGLAELFGEGVEEGGHGGLGESPGEGGLAPARADDEEGAAPPASADPTEEPPASWIDTVVIRRAGDCPSVPMRDGAVDLEALSEVIQRVRALAPGCELAHVGAPPDVRWGVMAPVMVRLARDGLSTVLTVGVVDVAVSCEGALVLP